MPIKPEEKALVADRLRSWINNLPPSQKDQLFFHALGVSLTPSQMLQEVEGESQLGEIIVNDQMKVIRKHQFR